MRFPGTHGTMASSDLEALIRRNSAGELAVIRAGADDGEAGLYNSVSGEYYGPICGGRLPEYTTHTVLDYDCPCTPGGECRSGQHGIRQVRGWRNNLYQLLARHLIRPTREIRRYLGDAQTQEAFDYGMWGDGPGVRPLQETGRLAGN